MTLIKNILLLYFLTFSSVLIGQQALVFQQLKGENVSTQSITYAIKQDSIGNVWIASEEGVLKHNSNYYKVYNSYNGLPESLNNRVSQLFIDSKQRVWAGLEKGVCVYNSKKDKFDLIGNNNEINPSLISSFTEDINHNIWIGGYNGLWKYNYSNKKVELEHLITNQQINAMVSIDNSIFFASPNGFFSVDLMGNNLKQISNLPTVKNITTLIHYKSFLFIGTADGRLLKYNLKNHEIIEQKLAFPLKNTIRDIVVNNVGEIYLAIDGKGLIHLDSECNFIAKYEENPDNIKSISSNGVYDIELGKENMLWLATYGGGINYFDANKLPFINIEHELNNSNSIAVDFTRAIAKDKNGNLWFGTKKGISILNKSTNTWKHIKKLSQSQNTEDIVLALAPDNNHMWIGTYNNGLYKTDINTYKSELIVDTKEPRFVKKIYSVFKDRQGSIWLGGISGELTVINTDGTFQYFPINNIKFITEDNKGNILATGRNGIFVINPKTQKFKLIEAINPNKDNLAYANINAVTELANKSLIIATNGSGLVFYDFKNVKKLTISNGLPSDIIQGVIAVNDSVFWASTTKGLAQIIAQKKDTIINVFDKRDGLASTEFNYGSFSKLSDSLITFGGVEGVSLFNPFQIKEQIAKPYVVFDEFKLFNNAVLPGSSVLSNHINQTKEVNLENNQNSLEIKFTGVLHSSSSKIKYSWKLDNFSDEWTLPSYNSFATFTNLSSGKYVFRVKASNKFGIFGPERQLKIVILSPWWATSQAIFVYLLLGVLLVYLLYHFTNVMVKKKNADEQINFFNNITHEIKTPLTILMSSLDNVTEDSTVSNDDSKKRIKTTVKRINALFEQMLNFHKVTSQDNFLQDISGIEIDQYIYQIINNFKPLTQERNIEISFTNNWPETIFYFDKETLDKILYNVLSNAIKYSNQGGKINVRISKNTQQQLEIEIQDYGLGIPKDQQKFILKHYYRARNVINSQQPGTGLGLIMVKKLIDKTKGHIGFNSEENVGTTFTIKLRNYHKQFQQYKTTKEKTIIEITNQLELQTELQEFSDSKILIVEDNDELRELLVDTLGAYFQIFEAHNGKQGLEIAGQVFPDIILTDLIMPELDGMQMAKKIKDDISLNHIPVFMLTVLQNSEQKIESLESGISEYLEKPINIKIVLAKMINTLKWQKKLRQKYVHDNDAENASLFRNKNDKDFLKKLEETIIENINNNSFSVHDLSASLGMSRTSLYMKLKNLVDLSPQDFIIHTKLKFAKDLLIRNDRSIKEIAYSCGFSNPKYFSTSFKKFYGVSPSAFLDSLKTK